MKKTLWTVAIVCTLAIAFLFRTPAAAQSTIDTLSVALLQRTSPGVAQPGHLNIVGNVVAGGTINGITVTQGSADPTGNACTAPALYARSNGTIYTCSSAVYAAIAASTATPTFTTLTVTGASTLAAVTGTTAAFTSTVSGAQVKFVIAKKTGANMNSTADQTMAVTIPSGHTTYVIDKIEVTNASTSLTTAAGGFYTAASKGGTAIVANTQVYSSLTAAGKVLNPTIAVTDTETAATLYFSLTTAQGSAATADIYVVGHVL